MSQDNVLRDMGSESLGYNHCLQDSETGPQLRSLPNNIDEPLCTYLFVAMEPSGNWLSTEAEGRRRVGEGYVNFATQLDDCVLIYAIRK